MMLTAIDPPTFSPPQKNDVDRLRNVLIVLSPHSVMISRCKPWGALSWARVQI